MAVGALRKGLASEAGVATAILEAVDDITPRSGRIPGCLRKLGKAAAVAVPKAAVARAQSSQGGGAQSCVDVEAMPMPAAPRLLLHTPRWVIAALADDRLVLL